ncbi:MAG TPA: adenylate/guanylate cyclase domain-containing protein [Ginsengibacter sp.]
MYLLKNNNNKHIPKEWKEHVKFFIAGWYIALLFFYVMRQVGVSGLPHFHFTFLKFILLLPVLAVISGITFGSLHYVFQKYFFRKIPLWQVMLRLCIDQLLIISLLTLLYYLSSKMMGTSEGSFWNFLESPSTLIYYLYVFLVNLSLSFLWEITRLLGRGNFTKLITGRFYSPKEEYRIFMFVDLNSSTTIAEKLGHVAYSNFIKDCFYDLAVVHHYNAQIYQYVGDEAVLTWERDKMKRVTECIDAFWAFDDELLKRSRYYHDKYGIIPEFKAGMSIGMVTVVEIGDIKKEIAYHGNTVNTASRIEAVCNIYNEKLLISKKLYDELIKEESLYTYTKIAETQLKGKRGITEIYSVRRTDEESVLVD